jgi:hypothetical protein
MTAVDISAAYWHVKLRKEDQAYVSCMWRGECYSFACLPFGLSSAPACFTRVAKVAVQYWRKKYNWNLIHYVDDLNFFSKSCKLTNAMRHKAIRDLRSLGWVINEKKCTKDAVKDTVADDGTAQVLPPEWGYARQRLEFLGFVVDTISMTFDVSEKRREKITTAVQELLKLDEGEFERAPVELIARCNGYIISLQLALGPQVRHLMRTLQRDLNRRPHAKACTGKCSVKCYRGHVDLRPETRRDLIFLIEKLLPRAHGMALQPRMVDARMLQLWTDASEHAMGGGLKGEARVANGVLPGVTTENLVYSGGAKGDSINVVDGVGGVRKESSYLRELRAIIFCLQALLDTVKPNTVILLRVDNQGVYYDLGGGRGSNKETHHELLHEIWEWCAARQVHIQVSWVPRDLNEWADWASKIVDTFAWMVQPARCEAICKQWKGRSGTFDLDAFSSATTRQPSIANFCSRWAQPDSRGNALEVNWGTFKGVWAAPPLALIDFALKAAFDSKSKMILIAPQVSNADWLQTTLKWQKGKQINLHESDFVPAIFGASSKSGLIHVPRHPYCARLVDFSRRKESDYLRGDPVVGGGADHEGQGGGQVRGGGAETDD